MFTLPRLRAAALGGALGLVVSFGGVVAVQSPASAQCGVVGPNRDEGVDHVNATRLHLRTGPSTRCGSITLLARGTPLALWCYRNGTVVNGNAQWTYVRHHNLMGWVSNAYLRHGGSRLTC